MGFLNDIADSLSRLEVLMVLLVAVTGFIHIYVGVATGFERLALAGFGFLGGGFLFLVGEFIDGKIGLEKGFTRAALSGLVLPYTGYQFVAYYSFYGFSGSQIAVFDKSVQALLLVTGTIYFLRSVR